MKNFSACAIFAQISALPHDGSTNVPEEIEMASGDPGTQPENKEEHRITTVTASSSDSSTSIASIQSSSVDETVIEIPASDEE